MKYRKKPVVIEAIQWTGNTTEIKEFCGNNCSYNVDDSAWKVGKGIPHEELVIHTLEGDMKARRNDYIIKGINGEFYPCKPDIFEKTYELAE
nr:MAG TPA: PGDYG protein [Caudoviricetes sp.]